MSSKFKGVFDHAKERTQSEPEEAAVPVPPPSPAPPEKPAKSKVGRPPGKRSNADYVQVTVYIQEKTHSQAKIALIKGSVYKDLSELTDKLLRDWLKSNA